MTNKLLSINGGHSRSAFSLIELVAAMAVSGILMVALGSAMSIASKTLTLDRSDVKHNIEAAEVLNQILDELATAHDFVQRSATVIEFTVPDRTGDFQDDVIRYEWTGGPGNPQPLTRQLNGGDIVTIAEQVREFDLSYLTKIVDGRPPPGPPPLIEGDEILLASNFNAPGSKTGAFGLSDDTFVGQYFTPNLPANTVHYKVTRVRFVAEDGGNGDLIVKMHEADAGKLPTTLLETQTFAVNQLPGAFDWVEVSFGAVEVVAPDRSLCLVFETDRQRANNALIRFEKDGDAMADNMLENDNGSWTFFGKPADLQYEIYGKATTQGAAQ